MKTYYGDFHIHTGLSPCADNDMSPSNIVNMAAIKGLDMIAVADHNSAQNLLSVNHNAEINDILLIPAIEVNTKEEVHILCYFPNLKSCLKYSEYLYKLLPDIPCDPKYFGDQLIYDDDDHIIGKVDKLLINSLPLTVDEIFDDIDDLQGVPIFAHIDKKVNSVLSSLGFIPPHLKVATVEVTPLFSPDSFKTPIFDPLPKTIRSSDAHSLKFINECDSALYLEEKSITCFLNCLKQK